MSKTLHIPGNQKQFKNAQCKTSIIFKTDMKNFRRLVHLKAKMTFANLKKKKCYTTIKHQRKKNENIYIRVTSRKEEKTFQALFTWEKDEVVK